MAEDVRTIERHAFAGSRAPSDPLKLTVADVCTPPLVMPAVATFTREYPGVDVGVMATRDNIDLTARRDHRP